MDLEIHTFLLNGQKWGNGDLPETPNMPLSSSGGGQDLGPILDPIFGPHFGPFWGSKIDLFWVPQISDPPSEIRHPKYMKSQYLILVVNQYYSIPGSIKECYYLPKCLYPRLEHSDPKSIGFQELPTPCSKVLKLVKSETPNP